MRKIIISLFTLSLPLLAQFSEQDVRYRLDLIHSGKIDQVRNEMPTLQRQYPNDVGIKYLDAYLTENGDQAVKKYQAIVDQFPQSEWADDALYKVYQYYYAVALYKTADVKLAQLNEQYPNSIYTQREVNTKVTISEQLVDSQKVKNEQQAPLEKPPIQTVSTSQKESGKYVIQVGVFSQENTAQLQAGKYTQEIGKKAIVFQKMSSGRTLFAVAFDGFEDEQSARLFGAELKSKFNMEWYLVKR
jgi:hypothetical protein